jgi:hypothetical protein
MTVVGQKATSAHVLAMSGLTPISDVDRRASDVCFMPKRVMVDFSGQSIRHATLAASIG